MKIVNYFKNSMCKITLEFNPFNWSFFKFNSFGPSEIEPNLYGLTFKVLFLTFLLILDDGTFNYIEKVNNE